MRSDRLLSILLLLQTHGQLPAPRLARELEVSVRTIHRDVEALSAAGVPVYAERGRTGGITLLPGYRTDVTGLTSDEARALFVLAGRGTLAEVGLEPALASALRKLMAAMPAPRRPELSRARDRVVLDPRGWMRAGEDIPAMADVQHAVWDDRRLALRYRRGGDPGPRSYTVDPYGLVSKAGVWYLIAAHRGTDKLFRVSRVVSARVLDAPSSRPADLDLDALWDRLRAAVETRPFPLQVELRVRTPWLERVLLFCRPQLVGEPAADRQDEGWTAVTATFRGLLAARGALLGFGTDVQVLAPDGLRRELADTAAAVAQMYRAGY